MDDLEMKQKVAQEIMDLMDQKDGERLKNHPKLMAASITVDKKNPLDMLKGKGDDEDMEDPKEEALETPEMEKKEDGEGLELTPELVQKLLEMASGK